MVATKAISAVSRPSTSSGQAERLAGFAACHGEVQRAKTEVNLIQGKNGSCKSVKSNFGQDQQDLQDFLEDKSLNALRRALLAQDRQRAAEKI